MTPTRLRLAVTVGTVVALALLGAVLAPRTVAGTPGCWAVGWRCHTVNAYRAGHDRAPLDQTGSLQRSAGAWARQMAASDTLSHSPAAGQDYAEVVGVAPDWATMLAAWDQSPRHRTILLSDLSRVGVGCARDGDLLFCAVELDRT
jgi:hypothetical protein